MTNVKETVTVKKTQSLYVGLLLAIVSAVFIAGVLYVLLRFASVFIIDRHFASDESKRGRIEDYVSDLQAFVDENVATSAETDVIEEWIRRNRYVYLLVYKEGELFFSSDSEGDGTIPPLGSGGITVEYPDREELIRYAEENGQHLITLGDGTPLFASVAEFTEYLYYDIANLLSFAMAMVVLSIVIINYFRQMIARIKRLAVQVTAVSSGDMNSPIVAEGGDEISKLSRDVDNMRASILENLRREREARDANTELITSMSHDIRTPLTVLLGYIDVMKSYTQDEIMQTYVAASEKTAMRLKQLSDDMFKYSIAFGKPEESMKLELYDADTLIGQMLSEHILLLEESGYGVDVTGEDAALGAGATVYTDAQYLMRIVDNIFSNIYKYADVDEKISVDIKRNDKSLSVTIKNKIKKNKEDVESNGIGLKTCARLAEYVAEKFSYEESCGEFAVTLTLKISDKKDGE